MTDRDERTTEDGIPIWSRLDGILRDDHTAPSYEVAAHNGTMVNMARQDLGHIIRSRADDAFDLELAEIIARLERFYAYVTKTAVYMYPAQTHPSESHPPSGS